MKIKITDEMGKNEEKEIQLGYIKVIELLEKLDIEPFNSIIMRKGEIITENEKLSDADEIKIINVIHGG